jgi:Flp pilus assembly protein TadG
MRRLFTLARDARGTMAIETAIVAPVLAMLSVGGFEVSAMVARQTELQSAAAEAEGIALAAKPDDAAKRTTLKNVIMASTGLGTGNVTVTNTYRCGDSTVMVASNTSCAAGQVAWTYVQIQLTDSYTPTWASWGFGSTMNYNITRRVMIG